MAYFEVTTSTTADRAVVALAGECDLDGRERLTTALADAIRRAPTVVVDAAGLTFLDSSGVHALVTGYQTAKAEGRRLHLVTAAGSVATVLDITGVATLLAPPEPDGGDGEQVRPGGGERGSTDA